MRTNLLNEILNKYSDWIQYGVHFFNPLISKEDDPFNEDCEYEIDLDKDGIQVILEYEFSSIFIIGLTKGEENYIRVNSGK